MPLETLQIDIKADTQQFRAGIAEAGRAAAGFTGALSGAFEDAIVQGKGLSDVLRNGRILALELAKLKSGVVELDLGLADGFATSGSIDAANSLNEQYDSPGTFWQAAASSDLTLRANPYALPAVPAQAHVALLVKENEAITINTDLLARISRDGGATFSLATLSFVRQRADGLTLYEASWLDLSAQPSGSSLVWQVETANAKDIEIHGIAVQVS